MRLSLVLLVVWLNLTASSIAVANLLEWLANGWLLSQHSSALLLEMMGKGRAFPERLRAGLPTGWLIADKSAGATSKGVSGSAVSGKG